MPALPITNSATTAPISASPPAIFSPPRKNGSAEGAAELKLWAGVNMPLILSIAPDALGPAQDHLLGADLARAAPQIVVPRDHWQAARSTGDWTLVSCIVSPGFQFDGFELAAPGFDIPRA